MHPRPLSRPAFALAVFLASAVGAQTTTPAATDPAVDPTSSVDAILDRLHDVGASLKTLQATVVMNTHDLGTDRDSTRGGTILIQRRGEGDTRGRVNFTTSQSGNRRTDERVEYLLDGDWVTDRVYRKPDAAASVKSRETRRQIRAPGTKSDLLKLGAGPFPLPIGQPKEAVRQQFDVALAPHDATKAELDGVTLTPRKGTPLADKFGSIVVWLRPDAALPSVIETFNKDESERKTTTLSDVVLNAPTSDAAFTLDPIGDDWTTADVPYQPPASAN